MKVEWLAQQPLSTGSPNGSTLARHRPRLPGIGALPSPSRACPASEPAPGKKLKDCLLQSCCHPRIASFNPVVTPGLRGTPRGTPRGHVRKNGTCLFPVPNSMRAATKKWLVIEARPRHLPGIEAPGRATCPASEPPACQARAKVGILPTKQMSRLSKPTTVPPGPLLACRASERGPAVLL